MPEHQPLDLAVVFATPVGPCDKRPANLDFALDRVVVIEAGCAYNPIFALADYGESAT